MIISTFYGKLYTEQLLQDPILIERLILEIDSFIVAFKKIHENGYKNMFTYSLI